MIVSKSGTCKAVEIEKALAVHFNDCLPAIHNCRCKRMLAMDVPRR